MAIEQSGAADLHWLFVLTRFPSLTSVPPPWQLGPKASGSATHCCGVSDTGSTALTISFIKAYNVHSHFPDL